MLAGPEPQLQVVDESFVKKGEPLPPAAVGSSMDPTAVERALEMWKWCAERGLNIRDLAMQFALNAPLNSNGIVLTGPANLREFEEAYSSATREVPESVWEEFGAVFGVKTQN
jgi:hypothetical protein